MRNKRIFVVEDESIVSLEIQSRLISLGFDIAGTADSGEEAIRMVLKSQPDLVMMDIKIKGELDGIQTAERIKEKFDVPIIYLTAFADDTTVERARVTGPYGYLIKPFEERELQITIGNALYKHETQRLIKEKDKWFSTVLLSVGDGVIATDEYGIIRFINPVAERLTGYISSESIGKNLSEVYNIRCEDTKKSILYPFTEVLEKGKIIGIVDRTELVQKSGQAFPIVDSSAPIKDDNGKIIGVVVVFQDMTYYRSTEELLNLQNRALDAAYNGIIITDKEGMPVWANESMERLVGYKRSEILNKNLRLLKSNEHGNEFYEHLWNTITSGNVWQGELINRRKDGSVYNEEMTITPIKNRVGEINNYVAIKNDITERIKTVEELKAAKEKAEELNRLKTSFLANMSHELRTPLIGILGFSEILCAELTDQKLHSMAEVIHQAGNRLLETLNLVLDLSKYESQKNEIKFEATNVSELIEECTSLFFPVANKKGLHIKTQFHKERVVSITDRKLLQSVLNNLIGNAIKFTHKGGVTVELDIGTDNENFIIKVSDTGIGIAEKNLKIIFEEFRQVSEGLNRFYQGSGLGLTLTKKFVHKLNGNITVRSEVGIGSEFIVTLPYKPQNEIIETVKKVKTTNNLPTSDPMQIKKILFVDDDIVSRDLVKLFLNKLYIVDTACDARDASRLVNSNDYSLLLLDINLGGGESGIEILNSIRENEKYLKTPVVAVTAYAMEYDKKRFLSEGFDGYLAKPFLRNEFLELVNHFIGSEKQSSD